MSERVIRVQPSELISAANNITTYRGDYIDAYDDIMTKAQNLTNTTWGGTDAETFAGKVNTFKSTFIQMESVLQEYINFLNKTAEAYKQAQVNVTSQASSLSSKV